jgi:hypothetical protein
LDKWCHGRGSDHAADPPLPATVLTRSPELRDTLSTLDELGRVVKVEIPGVAICFETPMFPARSLKPQALEIAGRFHG